MGQWILFAYWYNCKVNKNDDAKQNCCHTLREISFAMQRWCESTNRYHVIHAIRLSLVYFISTCHSNEICWHIISAVRKPTFDKHEMAVLFLSACLSTHELDGVIYNSAVRCQWQILLYDELCCGWKHNHSVCYYTPVATLVNNPAWIGNHIPSKPLNEITYSFSRSPFY